MAFDFARARREHGPLVVAELEGEELVFRPLTPSEAHKVIAQTEAAPEFGLDVALATCRACCLFRTWKRSTACPIPSRWPFPGTTGVIGELINLARGAATLRVKDGVRLLAPR
jgi:hypothetical protein